jgi:hypothetical protein
MQLRASTWWLCRGMARGVEGFGDNQSQAFPLAGCHQLQGWRRLETLEWPDGPDWFRLSSQPGPDGARGFWFGPMKVHEMCE